MGAKSADKGKKATGQPQGGVPRDRGQRAKRAGVSGDNGDRGKRGGEESRLGGVPSDSKRRRKGGVTSDIGKGKKGQGPGWNSKKAVTGFTWDPKEGRIKWEDGSEILSPKAEEEETAEAQKDRAAVQVAMGVFAGTQLMGPVYRPRTGVEYIPLDERVEVYSAAQQKTVRNIPFNIMEETAEQTLVIVVRELKRRRPGVKMMRLGEVWLSPPCNTFCKMDSINKEHQCKDSGDPLRKPIEGMEKGDLAKEADELMREALMVIAFLACMKDKPLRTGEM